MEDNVGAICPEESTFIAKGNLHDLMPVSPKSKSPLRRWISRQKTFPIAAPFKKPPSPYLKHVDAEGSQYFSDQLIDATVYFITVTLAILMLVAPLWWLNFVASDSKRLSIITAFVVVFSAVVGAVTAARPFETVAATAG
jgi:predicted lysophospholipase L1 biosynthesis ABC-type transport system permease subunit